MRTYATAEQARQRAVAALRAAGLDAEADRLAALPPITDRESALAAADATWAATVAAYLAGHAAPQDNPYALYAAYYAAPYALFAAYNAAKED